MAHLDAIPPDLWEPVSPSELRIPDIADYTWVCRLGFSWFCFEEFMGKGLEIRRGSRLMYVDDSR